MPPRPRLAFSGHINNLTDRHLETFWRLSSRRIAPRLDAGGEEPSIVLDLTVTARLKKPHGFEKDAEKRLEARCDLENAHAELVWGGCIATGVPIWRCVGGG